MPYITITVPSGTMIGRTVEATIGAAPRRVTLLSEETLRIEPDDVCSCEPNFTSAGTDFNL